MTPGEMVAACIAGAIVLSWIAFAAFDAWHRPRIWRRFQATAREAARNTGLTARHVLDAPGKARRRIGQRMSQHDVDKAFEQVTAEYPTIPRQTRRTEEDQ